MFLTACSPMSSKVKPSLSRAGSCTHDDVAEIDADAEFNPPLRRHASVALSHAALDLDGAAHGVNHAGELDQHAVAGGLDDAAVMLLDLGVDQRPAVRPQLRERALLVGSHQPAVADHVRRQDGGELAFGPRLTHGSTHRIAAFIIHAAATT